VGAIGAGQYDLQTIATHELGHAVGLEHSADTRSAMYASLGMGITRRGFTDQDLALLTESHSGDDHNSLHAGLHAQLPTQTHVLPLPKTGFTVPSVATQLDSFDFNDRFVVSPRGDLGDVLTGGARSRVVDPWPGAGGRFAAGPNHLVLTGGDGDDLQIG